MSRDVQGLIDLIGGEDQIAADLDALFDSPADKATFGGYGFGIQEINESIAADMGSMVESTSPARPSSTCTTTPDNRGRLSRDPIGEWGGLNLYGYVGNDPLTHSDSWGLADRVDCKALKNAIQRGYSTFQRDSELLANALRDQRAALTQLFVVDRAVDAGLTLGLSAGGEIIAAKVVARGTTLIQGESLGVDLVRGGMLSGPGLSQSTRFVTVAGVGGAVAGAATAAGVHFAGHVGAHSALHHSPISTEGVRALFDSVVESLNESLDEQAQELADLRKTFRANCDW